MDKQCKRLTRRRWLGIIELGDVTLVDDKIISHLHRSTGDKVDLVLVGAGIPCQDLSSLLAGR